MSLVQHYTFLTWRRMSFLRHRIYRRAGFFIFGIMVIGIYISGLHQKMNEQSFDKHFVYPLDMDILPLVDQMREGLKPDAKPINTYDYKFISNCSEKCKDGKRYVTLRLLYVVKSAMVNVRRRQAIRKTWGYERRFSDVEIRTVFMVGVGDDSELQRIISTEAKTFGDIVQADFFDSYYNNTIKTMMAYKWVTLNCPNAKYVMFNDDDMYVSTKNVLRFLRNPTQYPEYLEKGIVSFDEQQSDTFRRDSRKLNQVFDFELPQDVKLYTGYVFPDSTPMRSILSKWQISLDEYPYSHYPPYVTAGSVIVSKDALSDLYWGSHFTKHFRFDDIYVAIVAKKMYLQPYHCSEFHFWGKPYSVDGYKYVVSAHGFDDPKYLMDVWTEQKYSGNA